jgi:hypothetical protein
LITAATATKIRQQMNLSNWGESMCKRSPIALVGAVILLLGGAGAAVAAPVLQVSGGKLLGAEDVDVGGVLYDVALQDGTCAEIFTGCDEATDFVFTTQASAALAAQALLDQVFVDGPPGSGIGFDTLPDLTAGCFNSPLNCVAWVPYGAPGFPVMGAWNKFGNTQDLVYGPASLSATTGADIDVWARFTHAASSAVPEPSAFLLLGCGIAAVILVRRTGPPCRPATGATDATGKRL